MIAIGLAFCFISGNWNIGAEGQYIAGAIAGGGIGLAFQDVGGPWLLPLMIVAGFLGGALYGLLPAVLKVRFAANEI